MTQPSPAFLALQAALAGEYSLQRELGIDLAPLTTLMDAARRIGEGLDRLAEAQREAGAAIRHGYDARPFGVTGALSRGPGKPPDLPTTIPLEWMMIMPAPNSPPSSMMA